MGRLSTWNPIPDEFAVGRFCLFLSLISTIPDYTFCTYFMCGSKWRSSVNIFTFWAFCCLVFRWRWWWHSARPTSTPSASSSIQDEIKLQIKIKQQRHNPINSWSKNKWVILGLAIRHANIFPFRYEKFMQSYFFTKYWIIEFVFGYSLPKIKPVRNGR